MGLVQHLTWWGDAFNQFVKGTYLVGEKGGVCLKEIIMID